VNLGFEGRRRWAIPVAVSGALPVGMALPDDWNVMAGALIVALVAAAILLAIAVGRALIEGRRGG
jgi:hypothetical protein